MRFDFLHDETSPALKIFRNGIGAPVQGLLYGVLTAALLLVAFYGLAALRVRSAEELNSRAQARLQSSQVALSNARVAWADVRALTLQAQRLRELRLSGSLAVLRLAKIGDTLPSAVWLESYSAGGSDYDIRAETERFEDLARTFQIVSARVGTEPTFSVSRRAGDSRMLEFELRPASVQR
jgi:hypothetical protein